MTTALTLTMGPVDDRPPLSNRRSMLIHNTSVWITISPPDGTHPIVSGLRAGALVTAAQLGRLIPGLSRAQWKHLPANDLTKIANEYATEIDGLKIALVFSIGNLSLPQAEVNRHLDRAARMLAASLQSEPGSDVAESWEVTVGGKPYTVCVRGDRSWWAAEEPVDPADPVTAKVVHAESPPADVRAAVLAWAKSLNRGDDIQVRHKGTAV
ncbi:hypothetical protein [Paraburkholderia heleia]|uniref:hypothetical protein n=1 Tax=Paraburkholderia heleia TaxID=634127 RepID=UPI0031E1BB00